MFYLFKTLLGFLLINFIFQVATPIGDPPVTMEVMEGEKTIIAITTGNEIFAISVFREEREGTQIIFTVIIKK